MIRLTVQSARDLPFNDLIDACDEMLAQYDPQPDENELTQLARINRTLDELPAIHRFLVSMHARFDHATDAMSDQWGLKSNDYKWMRQRRDAMEQLARTCKLRYEATSRLITLMTEAKDDLRSTRSA